jgi:hypothetical protein
MEQGHEQASGDDAVVVLDFVLTGLTFLGVSGSLTVIFLSKKQALIKLPMSLSQARLISSVFLAIRVGVHTLGMPIFLWTACFSNVS